MAAPAASEHRSAGCRSRSRANGPSYTHKLRPRRTHAGQTQAPRQTRPARIVQLSERSSVRSCTAQHAASLAVTVDLLTTLRSTCGRGSAHCLPVPHSATTGNHAGHRMLRTHDSWPKAETMCCTLAHRSPSRDAAGRRCAVPTLRPDAVGACEMPVSPHLPRSPAVGLATGTARALWPVRDSVRQLSRGSALVTRTAWHPRAWRG